MNGETGELVEGSVRSRYSRAAAEVEAELCCPVVYDPRYPKVIPREILEWDYGCGPEDTCC